MKALAVVLACVAAVSCLSLLGCDSGKPNTVEGVWELVTAKETPPDTTIQYSGTDHRQIKIITKSHFAFIYQKAGGEKFTGEGTDEQVLKRAKSFFAGGGTYSLDGDTYTEHIEFFFHPNFIGMSIPFKVKIEGDRLVQTGTMPYKAAGVSDRDVELYEEYKRIE
jgi:hypothetical protein